MKDQIISFETAKLAKDKKFFKRSKDHGQVGGSWYNELGRLNGRTDLNKEGKTFREVYPEHRSNTKGLGFIPREFQDEFNLESYYAPTQSLLQKWLREKHDIHIHITFDFITYSAIIVYMDKVEGPVHMPADTGSLTEGNWTKTYEETLEVGLQEALEMIG